MHDCGLYALAFCAALCAGNEPQHITFSKTDMRKHLLQCFTRNEMQPSPGEKVTRKKRVMETVMLEIFCTCRSIEDGNMVECEDCKEWFHQGCLTAPQSVWKKTLSTMDVSFMQEKSTVNTKADMSHAFQISSFVCVACIH